MIEHNLVLVVAKCAGEVSPALAARCVGRVLVHDGEVRLVAADVPDTVEDRERVIHVTRQNEMAHDDAAKYPAILAERATPARARDLEHFLERRRRDLRIIASGRERTGERRVRILEVRQPYVDDLGEETNGLHRLVAAGIAEDGHREARLPCGLCRLDDLRSKVAGRDEVDVERALGLELEHHLGKACDAHVNAEVAGADLRVLAEDAAQGTTGEEDGAAARLT